MTQQGLVTTPFGRRRISLGLIATQQQARAVEPEKTVHKWKVFQAISEAKDKLGLPDRAIAVLQALLSFHGVDGRRSADRFPLERETLQPRPWDRPGNAPAASRRSGGSRHRHPP
jgi:hypothetical protein